MSGCGGVSSSRIGIGFVCVIGAALASLIGALAIAIIRRPANDFFLAASLAFAGGVVSWSLALAGA